MTTFGTSAAFIAACMKAEGLTLREGRDLSALRAVGSTGSPLVARGLSVDLRPARIRHVAVLDLGRDRSVHRVRGRCADAPGLPGGAAGALARRLGGVVGPRGPAADRRGRRARDHPADALDAGLLLGRLRWVAVRGELLQRVPGDLAPRRLDRDHVARDRGDLRPLGLDDQPRRDADGHFGDLPGGAGASTRSSTRWWSTCRARAATAGCRCSSFSARARRWTRRW